jgi:hypothetical protein
MTLEVLEKDRPEWKQTRWWRVTYADERTYPPGHRWEGNLQIWSETSNEAEARRDVKTCPGGGVLWRQFERVEREWRDA